MLRFLFSKTFILQLILAGIFIALVILGTYFFLINYAKTGEAVSVPNLEGYDLVEAEAELTQLDLEIEVIDSIFHLGQQGGTTA
jgi:beta-lactam-binding protein with PASTA domain